MRVLTTKLRVEIENEMRIILESLNFEIEMRVSQKSVGLTLQNMCLPHSIDLTDSKVLVKASGDHFWADSRTGCWRPTEKRCDSMTRKSEGISWMSSTTSWTSDSASTFNSVLLNLLVRTDSKKNPQISYYWRTTRH